MVVEKGFKQTELGTIPEDWEVKSISDIVEVDSDNLPSQTNPNYYFKYISLEDVDNGQLRSYSEQIFKNAPSRARRKIRKDDVLISTVRPNLKSHLLISNDVKDFVCSTGFAVLRNNGKIDSVFLYNHFFSSIINRQIENLITGSNYPAINSKEVKSLVIPIPPLPEQTAIANALSDMDALIAQTEKLIEKKKAIKQGVMQKLLKPKEGWGTKKLGDYGKTYGGITGKTKSDFGKGNGKYIPFMNIMSNPIIDVGYLDKVDIKSSESQNRAVKGDLFFNGSSETPEEVGLCSVLTEEFDDLYLNSFCFGYRMNNQNDLNGLFLSYLFRSTLGRNLIFSLAQGATRYNLSKTNLLKLELPIPSKKEQDIIALTLLDLDRSIKATQTKLTKLKHQKQGMMQALLTGKVRLI